MADAEYVRRILQKTDLELRQMLLVDSANYREEAIEAARSEAIRRGLSFDKGPDPVPVLQGSGTEFAAASRPIVCTHCGGTRFIERRVLLDTRTSRFVDFDPWDTMAQVLSCVMCGRMEWFEGECRPSQHTS